MYCVVVVDVIPLKFIVHIVLSDGAEEMKQCDKDAALVFKIRLSFKKKKTIFFLFHVVNREI